MKIKSKKDIEKLAKAIADNLQDFIEESEEIDDEMLNDEETFHLIVDNVNDDDLDYILITPNKLTISATRGIYENIDAVWDFLDENDDELDFISENL